MAHSLFQRSTIPAWITLFLVVIENVRRIGGWWREIDFFWSALKRRNEVLDAIISPYGQLGLIAIALVWLFVTSRQRAEKGLPPAPLASERVGGEDVNTETAPQAAAKTTTAVVPPNERMVVDVTPEYLTSFFEKHTSIQATKLVEDYIGKWIKVAGPLGDVYPNQVTFERTSRFGPTVFMYFDMNIWKDRLAVLRRSRRIEVLGQLERVSAMEVHLKNCELISS